MSSVMSNVADPPASVPTSAVVVPFPIERRLAAIAAEAAARRRHPSAWPTGDRCS